MPSTQTYREYAMMRGQFVEWNSFVAENDWAKTHKYNEAVLPDKCASVYYVVDKEAQAVTDRLCMTTFDKKYKNDFKELNLVWVKEFFAVEESDIRQLETPEEAIIAPGGEIFFLVQSDGTVGGVVSAIIAHGECELAKMTVRKSCTGKGYAHLLMREAIQFAKDKKYPYMKLYSSVSLENAIALYKKYGFKTIHLGQHPAYKRCSIIMQLDFDQQQ